MNIYQPYEELADTPDTLHLKLGDARERMLFVVFRAVPIALFLLVWYVLQEESKKIPMGINYLYVLVSGVVIFLLFFRSYITEVKIAAGNVFMVKKGITGVKEVNVPVQDVSHVIVNVRRGKGGGTRFRIYTRQNKRYTFIRIPQMMMNEKNTQQIAETLQHLLKVEIKRT